MIIDKILLTIFLFLITLKATYANPSKYLCVSTNNNFHIIFDTNNKKVTVENNNPKRYWTEPNFRFWHSAKDYNVYEYTFNYSFNKLSGKLEVKSHNLVTSEDKWYNYNCKINQ